MSIILLRTHTMSVMYIAHAHLPSFLGIHVPQKKEGGEQLATGKNLALTGLLSLVCAQTLYYTDVFDFYNVLRLYPRYPQLYAYGIKDRCMRPMIFWSWMLQVRNLPFQLCFPTPLESARAKLPQLKKKIATVDARGMVSLFAHVVDRASAS